MEKLKKLEYILVDTIEYSNWNNSSKISEIKEILNRLEKSGATNIKVNIIDLDCPFSVYAEVEETDEEYNQRLAKEEAKKNLEKD